MSQQHDELSDPRLFAATGLDRLGATPLRAADPRRVGPYAVLAALGGGGMGRIYLGRPLDGSAGLAAVKVIRPEYAEDDGFRRRFERESEALGRVHGEQAAVLLGTGLDGDLLWMATDYIPGLNLSEAVAAHGVLSAEAAWWLAGDLAQALAAMERVGVVHRDVKPSNVVLGTDGCRVIDFGISQAADRSSITTTGQQVGTPAYMSPEQVRGQSVATASDVFALGSVLAYSVTGNGPFGDGTSVDVLHSVAFEPPREDVLARVEQADPGLAVLVRACLDKDPAARPEPEEIAAQAASRRVLAPWSAALSAEIVSRVEIALAAQQLTLPQAVQPQVDRPQETVQLFSGAGEVPTPDPTPVPAPWQEYGPATPVGPPRTPPTLPVLQQPAYVMAAPPPRTVPPGPTAPSSSRRRTVLVVAGSAVAVGAIAVAGVLLGTGSSGAHGGADAAASGGVSASALPGVTSTATATPTGTVSASVSLSAKASGTTAAATPSSGATTPAAGAAAGTSTAARAATTAAGATTAAAAATTAAASTTTKASTPTTAPAASPTSPAWIRNCTYYYGTTQTQYGDTGARVRQVQCMLVNRGYGVGSSGVDGQFGTGTQAGVKAFQTAKGLQVDGQVGPLTWAALRSTSN